MSERLLVLATSNQNKAVEVRAALGETIRVLTLQDYPVITMPPEVGETFEENARAKAEYVAKLNQTPALADDSGLVVDALEGEPGVRSARYAEGGDMARVRKLLGALAEVPTTDRQARFVCAMAFARPGKETKVVVGKSEGAIGMAPRGDNGFGYDPVFLVEGDTNNRTMAELTLEEKNRISHRGRALRTILPDIARYFEERS